MLKKTKMLAVVLAVSVVAFAGLNTVHATVEFNINSGFEDGTVVPGLPGDYGPDHTAHPWSYWGNTIPDPDPDNLAANPQAANPNPFVDANNPSPRVWANFNNPSYVNVASQNDGAHRPVTGMWFVPGATYHFTGQWYVPSSEIVGGTVEPRGGFILSMSGQSGQPTYVQPLRKDYWDDPDTMLIPVINPVSATLATDQWDTKAFDWVFDPTYLPQHCNYPSIRLYGGDGIQYIGGGKGAPNPGGYFDNFSITSDDYRDDLHGFVKDLLGNPVEGAVVRLRSPFFDYGAMTPEQIEAGQSMDEVITLADGSYTLPTWAPHGYEFSVSSPGGGPELLLVTSGASQFPDIIVPEPATMGLLLFGGLGVLARRRRRS